MALTATTLNGAITADATAIRLASSTGIAVGNKIRVDAEFMQVVDVSLAPTIKVQRGVNGTAGVAHNTGAVANYGPAADFARVPAPSKFSYAAAGAIEVKPGTHVLKAGSAAAMTIAAPTGGQNGMRIRVVADAAQAYTLTNASPGFNNGGTASDVATFGGAIGDSIDLEAVGGHWDVVNLNNVTLG